MRFYFSKTEQYAVVVLLLAIIGALFVLSYAYGKRERESAQQPFFAQAPAGNTSVPGEGAAETPEVVVHVTGAVKQPGVYNFPSGQRVIDAVRQAGGARADGYPDALNLAARLQDGERLYIPTKAEWQKATADQGLPALVTQDPNAHVTTTAASSVTTPKPKSTPRSSTTTPPANETPLHTGPKPLPTKTIALNSATLDQLKLLPGIGPVTAQKILDYRKEHGKFTDTAQLLDVPGLGPKTYEKITPYLSL